MKPCIHRKAIAQLGQKGEKNSVISRKLNVPLKTVQKIVKQLKTKENVDIKKRPGWNPSINTRRTRAIIKKRMQRNDGVSMNSIAKDLGIVRRSVQTIVKRSLELRSYL